ILPLPGGRLFAGEPKRGDVVVFMHPHWRRVMIKRVIALPGDTLEVRGERILLNGAPISSQFLKRLRYVQHGERTVTTALEYEETLDGESYLVHQITKGAPGDTTPVFVVPEGHLFFMGDNRDNSKDARELSGHCPPGDDGRITRAGCDPFGSRENASVGFVPIDHLIGRAETVLFTTKRCQRGDGLDCPPARLWKGL
ncbi:MAG: signal peptidase I, partial [Pseudomonadota bacterium]